MSDLFVNPARHRKDDIKGFATSSGISNRKDELVRRVEDIKQLNAALRAEQARMQKNQLDLAAQLDRARERTHTAELAASAATAERGSLASDATQAAARERAHVEQIANLQDELAKSHVPRRSMALFRAKAMLNELIAGFPPRSPHQSRAVS
ncbi:MAG: hypothetical protein JF619_30715 [Massilia sp.]|nr:hypothetical protein [Massilia sp.]